MPGPDFVKGFLKRHHQLSVRTANLIKRSRGELSIPIVEEFFNNFEISAAGVAPECILNYDETNVSNNPGAVKAIFKKGVKYAEQIRDNSKTAISVMFCGSASGVLLPPYVVYKGANVYRSWMEDGPKGAKYTATESGWFDSFCFADFFKRIALPYFKRLPGKKLMLGDNLSSHISLEVISLCRANNIAFVCLPPNSTHLMQPLDVGLFGPMKQGWRKQLRAYADQDPSANLLDKSEFPRMLRELIGSLDPAQLLPKAFEKCGLAPLNRIKVTERIPSVQRTAEIAQHVDQLLLEKLQVRRFGDGKKKKPRGKKLPAGQSYSVEEEEEDEDEVQEEEDEDKEDEDEDDEDEDEEPREEEQPMVEDEQEKGHYDVGDFVVATYFGDWYLAKVDIDQDHAGDSHVNLSYMEKVGPNQFKWPKQDDLLLTLKEDILFKCAAPIMVGSSIRAVHVGLSRKEAALAESMVVYLQKFFNSNLLLPNFYLYFSLFEKRF